MGSAAGALKRIAAAALAALTVSACSSAANASNPAPRYEWRGIHIDVARHYFDVATLKRLVDLEAHLHLNKLHVHFTDDAAWRLPSRRYPKLTASQHYNESQLRDLVRYARSRNVDVVPEIDLPAHSAAAIRAYPELACGSAVELCPSTAAGFADTVIAEAEAVFASPWIHTGGDEVTTWSKPQRAAFEAHLAAMLARKHRTNIVWDDEADVASARTIVMVWHLGNAARDSIASGHRVIMASDGPLYFNAAQGDPKQEPPASRYVTTLEQVYAFSAPATGVLGVEATLWSEKITSADALWYMLLPRAFALAEIASLRSGDKNWHRFYRSLPARLAWLDDHGYGYRIPNVMFRVRDPRARFESVAGNVNAATVYISLPAAAITAESSLSAGTTFVRIDGGAWKPISHIDGIRPPSIIEAYARFRGRRGAVTTLFVRRAQRKTTARSQSFDAVVSP